MAIVRRPPGLTVGHQSRQVALHRRQVQRLEGSGVVKVVAHRVAGLALLMQDVHRDLIGPPVAVGAPQKRAQRGRLLAGIVERGGAACLSVHNFPPAWSIMRRAYARFVAERKSINFELVSKKTYGRRRLAALDGPRHP
ncbi:hypothetical protein D3C86_1792350 [compost metagenome]